MCVGGAYVRARACIQTHTCTQTSFLINLVILSLSVLTMLIVATIRRQLILLFPGLNSSNPLIFTLSYSTQPEPRPPQKGRPELAAAGLAFPSSRQTRAHNLFLNCQAIVIAEPHKLPTLASQPASQRASHTPYPKYRPASPNTDCHRALRIAHSFPVRSRWISDVGGNRRRDLFAPVYTPSLRCPVVGGTSRQVAAGRIHVR